jgi:hypothetical protein
MSRTLSGNTGSRTPGLRIVDLLQVPGWGRRLHVVADWTCVLFLRADIVKIDLASEAWPLLCKR